MATIYGFTGWYREQSYDIYQDGGKVGSSNESRYVALDWKKERPIRYKVVGHNRYGLRQKAKRIGSAWRNYNNITYYTSWSLVPKRNFSSW